MLKLKAEALGEIDTGKSLPGYGGSHGSRTFHGFAQYFVSCVLKLYTQHFPQDTGRLPQLR